jgi:hypothetical protein
MHIVKMLEKQTESRFKATLRLQSILTNVKLCLDHSEFGCIDIIFDDFFAREKIMIY